MLRRLNGLVFVTLLFLSAFFGSIFLLAPLIPLSYFAPRLWRKCADRLVGYWLTLPTVCSFI